ncbi:MAG: DUF881 domain-containing protein [Candidatus Limnocylindria bacterium]
MNETPSAVQRTRLKHGLALLVPALLFGFLVTAQWQTQQDRSELAVRYNTPLSEAARSLQDEQNELKAQLAELRAELDRIQESAASQGGAAKELQARVEELRLRAGLSVLTGDGVLVQFEDAKQGPLNPRDIDKAICHSTDLIDIVNTAWKGGARAVAVNDERIIATSSVYCVGSTIMVNGTLMSPPFEIVVIGPQNQLLASFEDPNQLRDIKQRRDVYGLGFRVTRASGLSAPAYSGTLSVRFATIR